jgi:beta-glucosidase
MKNKYTTRAIFLTLMLSALIGCNRTAPYMDKSMNMDERVEDLLARMTTEQKLILLQGTGMSTVGIKSLGIPPLECSDGPFGAHRGSAITSFPCGIALAASWDTVLLNQAAGAIGREARSKNIQCLLGPSINIIRHPLGGRNFEYYSEDPFLNGRLAVAFTKGLQGEKVAATLKHFAVNNQEFYRNNLDVKIDERALREIYLPAFRDAVREGDAWSVMTAYNKINGSFCSENKWLLTDVLKGDWGFRGFVMPDWAGAHSSAASANSGLDCVVYDSDLFGSQLEKAVKNGEVSGQTITDMARRVLRVIFLTGLMDGPARQNDSAINSPEIRELNRKAAREGIVLLKNDESILPINAEKIRKLAVIGPNAAKLRMGGGGSSYNGNVFYQVSPLDGLQNAAGNRIRIEYEQGAGIPDSLIVVGSEFLRPSDTTAGTRGLWAEYFNNMDLKGVPVATQLDSTIDFVWDAGPSFYLSDYEKKDQSKPDKKAKATGDDYFSARWSGYITPPETGYYDFVTHCDDGLRLYIDDKLIIDQWFSHDKEYRYGTAELEGGKSYKIKVEYYEEIGGATIRFGWYYHDPKKIDAAVKLAKSSDAAVIFAGLDRFWEAEGADRTDFELPGIQNELIRAVASANPKTIVVLNNGGPLNVKPWLDKVPALMEAWFTGNEGGNAIADVLLGKFSPSGKLPYSYVQSASDFPPAFTDYLNREKRAVYSEGIYTGYRYHDKFNTRPLYPFGYGLSYTSFEYGNMRAERISEAIIELRIDVKNTGNYDASEIIQVYSSELEPVIDRPVKELKGFSKVFLKKGETRTVAIPIKTESLGYFDPTARSWKTNSGSYQLMVGSSSRDIRLQTVVRI